MTGYFLRIKRDGRWQNVQIDEMTDDELESLREFKPDAGWDWAIALAKWIRLRAAKFAARKEDWRMKNPPPEDGGEPKGEPTATGPV